MKKVYLFAALTAVFALAACDKEPLPDKVFYKITDPVFRAYCETMTTRGYPGYPSLGTDGPDYGPGSYQKPWDLNGDGRLSAAEAAKVKLIDAWQYGNPSKLKISSLAGIEYFTGLTELYCHDNQLTSLDVSKNTALFGLSCGGNQLTSLDVSANTALIRLYCDGNQLTSLDLSKNTALTELLCNGNDFSALDVSANTALTVLICGNGSDTDPLTVTVPAGSDISRDGNLHVSVPDGSGNFPRLTTFGPTGTKFGVTVNVAP